MADSRILVAQDGSPCAEDAVAPRGLLSRLTGALIVVPRPGARGPSGEPGAAESASRP